ncbi:MAG: hypothetical protein QXS21_05520 [Thermoproteota archaeon]
MDTLTEWMMKIEKVYPHTSKAVMLNLACVVGGKAVMNIAPSGCGKSIITNIVKTKLKDEERKPLELDSTTKSGLKNYSKILSNSKKVIIIDDLAKIETKYSLVGTVVSLTELCYSHFIQKASYNINFEITAFTGAAIMNCQPIILKKIMRDPAFEASIRDKCIRNYYFYRPTEPKPSTLIDQINNTEIKLNGRAKFDKNLVDTKEYKIIRDRFLTQFTLARAIEHIVDLSKSIAVMRERNFVIRNDLRLLKWITRGMEIEKYVVVKEQLEGERQIHTDIIDIMVEIVSHGEGVHIDQVCSDYQVSDQTVRNIIQREHKLFYILENRIYLTPEGKQIYEVIK